MLVGSILNLLGTHLPTWNIIPQSFLDGITWVLSQMTVFNILFPIDHLFFDLNILFNFLIYFFIAKLLISIVNWVRGSGEIKV